MCNKRKGGYVTISVVAPGKLPPGGRDIVRRNPQGGLQVRQCRICVADVIGSLGPQYVTMCQRGRPDSASAVGVFERGNKIFGCEGICGKRLESLMMM